MWFGKRLRIWGVIRWDLIFVWVLDAFFQDVIEIWKLTYLLRELPGVLRIWWNSQPFRWRNCFVMGFSNHHIVILRVYEWMWYSEWYIPYHHDHVLFRLKIIRSKKIYQLMINVESKQRHQSSAILIRLFENTNIYVDDHVFHRLKFVRSKEITYLLTTDIKSKQRHPIKCNFNL